MGVIFVVIAMLMLHSVFTGGISALRMLMTAVALVFLMVGVAYVRQSFGLTAYDVTYRILPQHLEVEGHGKHLTIPYKDIQKLDLKRVREDMDYCMLQIITAKFNFVMHIEGENQYAQEMYDKLLEYTNEYTDIDEDNM
jgi:hypothetical protein